MAARAARGAGADRPALRLRGRAARGRVAGRALRRGRRRGADRGRAAPTAPTGGRSGLGAALGALGGIAGLRGRRLLGAALGAVGAAGIADDFPPGQRRLRRLLPRRTTYNVVCEIGDPEAERTVVLIAHHDAAHSGLVFHPAIPQIADRLGPDREDRHQPAADGAGGRRPDPRRARGADRQAPAHQARRLRSGSARPRRWPRSARREVVPGANDNGTAVVPLLALAERLLEEPPQGIRVILLSAGSEESFSEGIKAFGERHFAAAAPRAHLLPLPRVARLAPPARPARRGLPEDARVPARARSP